MPVLNKKIGFLGAGKMATALARGILDAGLCAAADLMAGDIDENQRKNFENQTGAKTSALNPQVTQFSDVVILSVKPHHVDEVLAAICPVFGDRLLVSIAAGIPVCNLEENLGHRARVIRVMPNTPALIRCGASAFAAGQHARPDDLQLTETILNAVGMAFVLPERMLDAVTGLSGSGPGYVFVMIEALADGGVEMGLPREVALKLAAQTVLGSAKLLLETGKHPGELKDMVTSPRGTTIEGIRVLEESGVRAAFMNAVRVATEKSKKLGEE